MDHVTGNNCRSAVSSAVCTFENPRACTRVLASSFATLLLSLFRRTCPTCTLPFSTRHGSSSHVHSPRNRDGQCSRSVEYYLLAIVGTVDALIASCMEKERRKGRAIVGKALALRAKRRSQKQQSRKEPNETERKRREESRKNK